MSRAYDRAILVQTLVHHHRRTNSISSGCFCGWNVLGASLPDHIADMYEESVSARVSRPALGLLAALSAAGFFDPNDQAHAARAVSAYLADHLDAFAEMDRFDGFTDAVLDAADEVRSVGGVTS